MSSTRIFDIGVLSGARTNVRNAWLRAHMVFLYSVRPWTIDGVQNSGLRLAFWMALLVPAAFT